MVAGMMTIPAEAKAMGARPGWMGYIWVEDVDAALPELTAAGGKVFKAPADIPGVGRFAVVADPDGAVFMLFRDAGGNPPPPPPPGTPGLVGWRELHAGDGAPPSRSIPACSAGRRRATSTWGRWASITSSKPARRAGRDYDQARRKRRRRSGSTISTSTAIDAAAERVKANGGKIVNGPMEVPGGQWVVQALDPQDAMFALVAPKR